MISNMIPKHTACGLVSVVSVTVMIALTLGSCATAAAQSPGSSKEADSSTLQQQESTEPAAETAAAFPNWQNGPTAERFHREYRPEGVQHALVQFFRLLRSYDYFAQFARGDRVFEDYLVTHFGLETGPFYPGKGVERTVYDREGGIRARITRVLVEEHGADSGAADGSDASTERWWQIRHARGEREILYETLVGPFGVPREVRLQVPQDGGYRSRITAVGRSLRDIQGEMEPEVIRQRLSEQRRAEVPRHLPPEFANLTVAERGPVTVAGRTVYALRLEQASAPGAGDAKGGGAADGPTVLYSPDVPGGILRVTVSGRPFLEITQWIEEGERVISDEMLAQDGDGPPKDAKTLGGGGASRDAPGDTAAKQYTAEGSESEPVRLIPGETHRGSVSAGGVSYYAVSAEQRSDLRVELMRLNGSAVLRSYRDDPSFAEWYTGSEGGSPAVTEYFVESGDARYFTVQSRDEKGIEYIVRVTANPLLDELGVRTRGEYRDRAQTLRLGSNALTARPAGLSYYELSPAEQGRITLTVEGLEEGRAKFALAAVSGGTYSALSSRKTSASTKQIRVQGVEPGSRLYFYLVTTKDATEREVTVTVE